MKSEKIDPASLSPEVLAQLLSAASKRQITAEQVREIAEVGNLLSVEGTINLVRYTSYLIGEKYRE
jgi:hypothetical protein